jgi:murein DD-endopeptidase MepM/ murein hydrolase activator NlpD
MTDLDPTRRPDGTEPDGILALLGFGAPATLGPLDAAPAPAAESIAPDSSFVAPAAPAAPAPVAPAPVDSFASLIAGVAPTSTLQAAQQQAVAVSQAPAAPVSQAPVPVAPAAVAPVPVAPAASHGSRREQREHERSGAPVATSKRRSAPASRKLAAPPRGSTRPERSHPTARKVGSRLLSLAAMIFAGALAVGMSVPANAFGPTGGDSAAVAATSHSAAKTEAQSVEVASTVKAAATGRDAYTVTSWAEMLQLKYGTRDYGYSVTNGSIRWPFPYVTPISSGFGERAAPCRACSSIHMGVDFTPGGGAPIYAVADGVVTTHDDDSGGFGNHVIIDHGNLLGDGVDIESLYAHMQHGSSPLVVGQTIKVGDFIGLVGMTGTATGNHLHLEIHENHVPVDPFAWLKKNAN